ncbi:hypothetical protein [Pseudonocardia pini]|uniref:hypothetical protein n=1 Tax=Pseudonocardia pini TaxID=2758030 RepID=UPI0015EFF885|nr:hypothetical protein [Pseudonocardia pini]
MTKPQVGRISSTGMWCVVDVGQAWLSDVLTYWPTWREAYAHACALVERRARQQG